MRFRKEINRLPEEKELIQLEKLKIKFVKKLYSK